MGGRHMFGLFFKLAFWIIVVIVLQAAVNAW
jgi:hypothetical protein